MGLCLKKDRDDLAWQTHPGMELIASANLPYPKLSRRALLQLIWFFAVVNKKITNVNWLHCGVLIG